MAGRQIRDGGTARLKSGETMAVRIMEPPIVEPYSAFPRLYWWDDLRDKVLDGAYADSSLDRFFVGEVDGEIVGSILLSAPADTRDVGLVEFVFTKPEHRSKGVMAHLLRALIDDFRGEGGKMLHLCTVNPVAADLYRKAGFVHHIGDGMRYLSPGNEDFDDTYLAYDGKGAVRAGAFGDIARFAALYDNPRLDWFTRYYIPWVEWRVFSGFRFEGHFRRLFNDSQTGGGHLLVLETERRRAVAAASLNQAPSYHEQHVKVLSFISSPAYTHELGPLLDAVVEESKTSGTEIVQTYLADFEEQKKEVLEGAGFEEGARLRNNLKLEGGRKADLLVYVRELEGGGPLLRGPEHYYGGRPADLGLTGS